MNLLIVNQEYPPSEGGAANACRHLARALGSMGHRILIVTGRPDGAAAEEADGQGCTVVRVPVPGYRGGPFGLGSLAQFAIRALPVCSERMRGMRFDRIWAFFTLPAGHMALRLYRATGCPYVVSLRGSDVPGFRYARCAPAYLLARASIRRVWRHAGAVVANSAFLRDLALRTWRGPIDTIPNGVDCERFAPPREGRSGRAELRLLTVGQLIPRKNPERLIAALPELNRRTVTPLRLRIVGGGPMETRLRRLARVLGVERQVDFAGRISPAGMPAEYAAADLFVLLSSREGMSNALLEAMAAGLPCVVTRTGDSEKIVATPDEGLVVDGPADPLEPLAALIDDPGLRLRLGENARRRVRTHYTWESAAADYAALFSTGTSQ